MQSGEIFDAPWVFLKQPDEKGLLLCVNTPPSLTPIFYFDSPDKFYEFVKDAINARDSFIPKSVVQAYKTVDRATWAEAGVELPEGMEVEEIEEEDDPGAIA